MCSQLNNVDHTCAFDVVTQQLYSLAHVHVCMCMCVYVFMLFMINGCQIVGYKGGHHRWSIVHIYF